MHGNISRETEFISAVLQKYGMLEKESNIRVRDG